ncbi:MAG: B12-binding domain-containing radical SAM protein [Lachnospiraceae bacterium]
MKIVLAALNAKYVHSNLAVYDIAAYTKEQLNNEFANKSEAAGFDMIPEVLVREYTINHNLTQILQALYEEKPNVIGFSCYIWNIQEILGIAKELHKVSPYTKIWLGGPEVSYHSKQLLEQYPFVEGVIKGEGEATFYELVKLWCHFASKERADSGRNDKERDDNGLADKEWADNGLKKEALEDDGLKNKEAEDDGLENKEDYESVKNGKNEASGNNQYNSLEYRKALKSIAGIVYRNEDFVVCENPPRPLIKLDEIPFIYKDLTQFQNKILYYETSRGCPFSCSYCLSSIDKSVRFRSMALVEGELQFFLDHNVPQVKFIDRTFNCKKEHALRIWNYLLEHDNGVTNFHFEVSADLIGEQELLLFQRMRPGLIQLEIGLQSTYEPTIKEIHRVMDIEKVKTNMATIRGFHNIHQHLDLIAGLPFEDFPTFKKSFNDAYEMKPNQLQLGFLKVLKGSYMETQAPNYELQYQDTQPYEVLSTKWLSYDEVLLLKQVEEMVECYYNSDQFEHVLPYLVSMTESPYELYEELGKYYKKNQLLDIGVRREQRYVVLRDFCMDYFSDHPSWDLAVFDSLLTFDYYLRENAKNRPAWSKDLPIDKRQYRDFFINAGNRQYRFPDADYDSKVAARVMHIEPVLPKALPWIMIEEEFVCMFSPRETTGLTRYYCLFDYEKRNALTKDATVVVMSEL